MERLHPNTRRSEWTLAFFVTLCLVGCNHQQMASSNPFMAPDRVPPPATRTIAPGTAAPYYPGDPMPGAQIVPPGHPPMVAQAQSAAPVPMPIVAIPTDDAQLRFAVPPPPAVENPVPQVTANPMPSPAPASQVVPAAYNQPIPVAVPMPTAGADSNGPWRAPQVPSSMSPVMQAQYVQPHTGPTILAAQPQQHQPAPTLPAMPVELRSVPSPQVASVEQAITPPPRMRFPSITDPVSWFSTSSAPPANQQLIGYMVPGPNGQMQMVPLEQYQQMQVIGTTRQSAAVASSDGFRPRTSAK